MDDAGRMLAKCFQGIPEASADITIGKMMSPRNQAAHLSECYVAAKASMNGEKHEWGTYTTNATTLDATVTEMFALRASAVEKFLALESEDTQLSNEEFLIGHDHYHVGQLVTLHLAIDPEWNSYCIYDNE